MKNRKKFHKPLTPNLNIMRKLQPLLLSSFVTLVGLIMLDSFDSRIFQVNEPGKPQQPSTKTLDRRLLNEMALIDVQAQQPDAVPSQRQPNPHSQAPASQVQLKSDQFPILTLLKFIWQKYQKEFPVRLVVVVLGTSAGIAVLQSTNQSESQSDSQQMFFHKQHPSAETLYERLNTGMTLTDVQARIGHPGTEISQDRLTRTHKWITSDGETIIAVFENNQLVSKSISQN